MGVVIIRLKTENNPKNHSESLAGILEFHLLTKKQREIIGESQAAQLILYNLIIFQTTKPYDYFYSYFEYTLGKVYTKEGIARTIDDLFNCGFIERYRRKSRKEVSEFRIKIKPKYRLNQMAGKELHGILTSYVNQILINKTSKEIGNKFIIY